MIGGSLAFWGGIEEDSGGADLHAVEVLERNCSKSLKIAKNLVSRVMKEKLKCGQTLETNICKHAFTNPNHNHPFAK